MLQSVSTEICSDDKIYQCLTEVMLINIPVILDEELFPSVASNRIF